MNPADQIHVTLIVTIGDDNAAVRTITDIPWGSAKGDTARHVGDALVTAALRVTKALGLESA